MKTRTFGCYSWKDATCLPSLSHEFSIQNFYQESCRFLCVIHHSVNHAFVSYVPLSLQLPSFSSLYSDASSLSSQKLSPIAATLPCGSLGEISQPCVCPIFFYTSSQSCDFISCGRCAGGDGRVV